MGVVVARPRRREYRSFGRRKHAGEACSIITGMITFKEGTLHQVSLGRGLALNGLPPPACLCLPFCGGSRRINQAGKNAVISRGTTSPATMPELPRSLSNIVDRSSSYKDNRKLPTFKRRKERKRFKTDARPERKMSPKGMKSEAAASV